MKRFLVFVEFVHPDNSDIVGQEPVKDFDTYDEALDFVSQQSSPESYVIDDQDADEEELLADLPNNYFPIGFDTSDRDTGDEVEYDDDEEDYDDEDEYEDEEDDLLYNDGEDHF